MVGGRWGWERGRAGGKREGVVWQGVGRRKEREDEHAREEVKGWIWQTEDARVCCSGVAAVGGVRRPCILHWPMGRARSCTLQPWQVAARSRRRWREAAARPPGYPPASSLPPRDNARPARARRDTHGGVGGAGGRRALMAAVARRARQRPHPARADRRPSFLTLLVARDEGEVRRVVVSTLSRRKGQLGERGGSFFLAVCQTHRAGGRRCDSLLPRHTKCRGRGERRLDTLEENPFAVRPLSGPQKTAASTNWREVPPSARCQ